MTSVQSEFWLGKPDRREQGLHEKQLTHERAPLAVLHLPCPHRIIRGKGLCEKVVLRIEKYRSILRHDLYWNPIHDQLTRQPTGYYWHWLQWLLERVQKAERGRFNNIVVIGLGPLMCNLTKNARGRYVKDFSAWLHLGLILEIQWALYLRNGGEGAENMPRILFQDPLFNEEDQHVLNSLPNSKVIPFIENIPIDPRVLLYAPNISWNHLYTRLWQGPGAVVCQDIQREIRALDITLRKEVSTPLQKSGMAAATAQYAATKKRSSARRVMLGCLEEMTAEEESLDASEVHTICRPRNGGAFLRHHTFYMFDHKKDPTKFPPSNGLQYGAIAQPGYTPTVPYGPNQIDDWGTSNNQPKYCHSEATCPVGENCDDA